VKTEEEQRKLHKQNAEYERQARERREALAASHYARVGQWAEKEGVCSIAVIGCSVKVEL
jgi:hypothetical protein